MSMLDSAAVVAPLAAGWSVHTLWMRRRIDAARRDPLTELHTRTGFSRRAVRVLRSGPAPVVLADVNDFKHVNNTYGHAAGDAILAAVADRMQGINRTGVFGRLGGDEFAAVLPVHPRHARLTLDALRSVACQDLDLEGTTVPVSVSFGGAILSRGRRTAAESLPSYALRRADEAMYTAKRTHGRTHVMDLIADNLPGLAASVNGRRDGRPGTHQPDGGTL